MLSASVEFLNAVPIPDPPVVVRPRIADPLLTQAVSPADGVGLVATSFSSAGAASAAADFRVAATYASQGNAAAASFFQNRATATDPESTTALQSASQSTVDLGSMLASKGLLTSVPRAPSSGGAG